jgi:hypothetical protein
MKQPTILRGLDTLPPFERAARNTRARKQSEPTNRWHTLNAFVDSHLSAVSGTAAKVWFILFRDTKPNGLASTSQGNLARRAGVCPRTVRTALRTLIDVGLVRMVQRGNVNQGASVYAVVTSGRILPVIRGRNLPRLRNRTAYFPERDQKGAPTLSGRAPDTSAKSKTQRTASVLTHGSRRNGRRGSIRRKESGGVA